MDEQRVEIELKHAPDEPSGPDPAFQEELQAFSASLREARITYSQRAIAFDSADAMGFPLGEFTLKLTGILVSAATAIVVAWINKRPGRGATIKAEGIDVTADRAEDAERAFEHVKKLQQPQSDHNK